MSDREAIVCLFLIGAGILAFSGWADYQVGAEIDDLTTRIEALEATLVEAED